MTTITLDELAGEHLQRWQDIDVVDDAENCLVVWDSMRQLHVGHSDFLGTFTRHGTIKVGSVSQDLADVYDKLTRIDQWGNRRLVRKTG